MFEEVVGGAKAAESIWEHRAAIAKTVKDLVQLATKGQLILLSFGAGGTGKTTLGRLLSGNISLGEPLPGYDLTLDTETYNVEGSTFVTLYVPPGQESKRAAHWGGLIDKMSAARRYAVFNVVCWGYHSIDTANLSSYPFYRPKMPKEDLLIALLNDRRAEEIRALKYLEPHLQKAPGKLRLITVVTKQDLWWKHRSSVRQHYENGEYQNILNRIKADKGIGNFTHDYTSACLNLLNFSSDDGRILKRTAEGYDSFHWIANFNRLIRAIRSIVEA